MWPKKSTSTAEDGTGIRDYIQVDAVRLEAKLGHKQELTRGFRLFSLTSLGIIIANSWAATGGTIVTALYNGGPMAVLYGLIVVSIFYTMRSASLAELASAIPSAGVLSTGGLFITIVVLAAMPRGRHASNTNVWRVYYNETGGSPDGICFLTGLLNAAFAVGTPDCISHLSEKKPETKVPQGIMLQMLTAFTTAFVYLIALLLLLLLLNQVYSLDLSASGPIAGLNNLYTLFYGISDLDAVLNSSITYFPTAEIYLQATGSTAGAVGLLALLFLATFPTLVGTLVTGGRMWWSLARDNATPFPSYFGQVHPTLESPVRATVTMSCMVTCLGCIYVGSTTAFQALISSFIVLSTLSYTGAILQHVLTGRKNIIPGPFYMGSTLGFIVNILAVLYIFMAVIFFCFPFVMPVTAQNMNYTSVITMGLMTLVAISWVFQGMRKYEGPKYSMEAAKRLAVVHEDSEMTHKQHIVEGFVGSTTTSTAEASSELKLSLDIKHTDLVANGGDK